MSAAMTEYSNNGVPVIRILHVGLAGGHQLHHKLGALGYPVPGFYVDGYVVRLSFVTQMPAFWGVSP